MELAEETVKTVLGFARAYLDITTKRQPPKSEARNPKSEWRRVMAR
jgi:hypothetical protein